MRAALHPVMAVRHPGLQSHQGGVRQIHPDEPQSQDVRPDHQAHWDHPSLQIQDESDAWDVVHRETAPEPPVLETDWDTHHLGHPEGVA